MILFIAQQFLSPGIAAAANRRIYYPTSYINPQALAEFYRPTLHHYIFRLSNEAKDEYQLVVVENDSDERISWDYTSPEGQEVIQLAQRAKDATWEEFRKEMERSYPGEYGEDRIKKMMKDDRLLGLFSARVIILEGRKPLNQARILSTLKLTAEGDDGYGLDVENTLRPSHPEYEVPRHHRFEIPYHLDQKGNPMAARPLLEGGAIQVSGFMNRGPRELGAIIPLAAVELALKGTESRPELVLQDDLRADFTRKTEGLIEVPQSEELEPSQFVAYCAKNQASYYTKWLGFKPVANWDPHATGEWVLSTGYHAFVNAARSNPLWRKGYAAIAKYGFYRIIDDKMGFDHWKVGDEGVEQEPWPGRRLVPEKFLLRERALDAVVKRQIRTRQKQNLQCIKIFSAN